MENEFRYAEMDKLPKGEALRAHNMRFRENYENMKRKDNVWNKVWETATDLRQKELDRMIVKETDEKVIKSLKRTRNLSKIYAARKVMNWSEELQSDMAVEEVTSDSLRHLAQKQEFAQQDYSNAIETALAVEKWPDDEFRNDSRSSAIEFSDKVTEMYQHKQELLFKKEIEKIVAVAHLGMAKLDEFTQQIKNKKKELALAATGTLSVLAVGCLGLYQLEMNKNSIVDGTQVANADKFRTTEVVSASPLPTLERAVNATGVVEMFPTVSPTARSTESAKPVKTESAVDYFSWLKPASTLGGNLDLSQPFVLDVSKEVADVLGYKNPPRLATGNIDVNRYNNAAGALAANWGSGFENPLLNIDMNTTAIEQGNNGRAIIYCHSGSVAGIEWPCNWVKLATWYPQQIIGKEIMITQGNFIYHFKIDEINTVKSQEYENAARVFSDPSQPMMRDLAGLSSDTNVFNKPGIDIVVCGGKGVPLHQYKTIISAELVKMDKVGT